MKKNFFNIIALLLFTLLLSSCAAKKITDVTFIENAIVAEKSTPKLNIFQTRKSGNKPVVIFIHGGYWDQGNKAIYNFLGRNFAKKDVVTVIPNYTLSPDGNYDTMAKEVAAAIQWTYDSIAKYNGNPEQIFLMGHSAGGHLIALVSTNPKYLKDPAIIKGTILNDAAGLDMYSYLKAHPPTSDHHYKVTWTEEPDNWKDASPIYFISEKNPPFLFFVGTKSFPAIITSNEDFLKQLKPYQPKAEIIYIPKKHVPMMGQFFFSSNKHFKEIIDFITAHK